ncbi:RagB/SusD family nutrient uptake outer membrane protein [Flavobacterium fluviatile]|uniref:RagB/SusD family nutrient uptake outer membrane protein n=1 Tax=Flavobacterium fluviatile TaxID=1862387 RepID=UPI0013D25145|nr:RagB/SusD family nutrient uptake outer membrane protein [Flavobacterium fluviatile]
MKKIIICIFSAALLISCSDLEENPVGILAPKSFFKSPSDVQAAVNGSFAYMASEKYWGRKLTVSLLLRGDMADIGDQTTSIARVEVNKFTMTDESAMVASFWPQSYAIIGAANQAIDGAKRVTGKEAEINAIAAQAYFARAFAYYNLVRLFGAIPYIDFAVSNVNDVNTLSKTPENEVYNKIISDLQYAKQWLPNKQKVKSLPTKGTAAAYLASVYLTLGDFQNAYTESKYVIDNETTFGLGLEADFQDLFRSTKTATLKEPLFTIDFIGQSRVGDLGQDYLASLTGIRGDQSHSYGEGWSVAVPTLKVFNDWDARDYRRAVSFDTTAVRNGKVVDYTKFTSMSSLAVNRPHIAKYNRYAGVAGSNGRESDNNYFIMRYAEVLLIAAEALNEITPGSPEATGYVNRLLLRARNKGGKMSNFPVDVPAGLSQTDLRARILNERRLELAFEFGRWFDIKRLKLGSEVFSPTGNEPQPNFDPKRDYYFPLPGDELNRNPNLLPNNAGY